MRKSLKFIILPLVAILLFWLFARNVDWQEVFESLSKARGWYVFWAVMIICVGYFLRAIRWRVLLEPITPASLRELFATTTVGFAAVFLVGRAGEIVRPMWLPMRDKRVRPSAALVTLGVERIFDLAAIVCFFAVNLIWFVPPKGSEQEFNFASTVGLVMLAGVIVGFIGLYLFYIWAEKVIAGAEIILDRKFIPRRIASLIVGVMRQLAAALRVLTNWRETAMILFWTLMLWASVAVPTWLVLLAFDLPLTLSDSLFIMGFAAVSSVVPTPGGAAGAFHAATAQSLVLLNVGKDTALATAIVMHLVYFAPAIIFGLYYFIHGDISVERFKSLLSSEHAVEEIESEAPNAV